MIYLPGFSALQPDIPAPVGKHRTYHLPLPYSPPRVRQSFLWFPAFRCGPSARVLLSLYGMSCCSPPFSAARAIYPQITICNIILHHTVISVNPFFKKLLQCCILCAMINSKETGGEILDNKRTCQNGTKSPKFNAN